MSNPVYPGYFEPCGACGDQTEYSSMVRVEVRPKRRGLARVAAQNVEGVVVPVADLTDQHFRSICTRCFYQPDWKAREAAEAARLKAEAKSPAPKPYHPEAAKACTQWPTYADAVERANLVTRVLSIRPNVQPVAYVPGSAGMGFAGLGDPEAPHIVFGDSPLLDLVTKDKQFSSHEVPNPLS